MPAASTNNELLHYSMAVKHGFQLMNYPAPLAHPAIIAKTTYFEETLVK
jgi:hypothetical protein